MRLIDADALKKRMLDLNADVRDVYNSSKTNEEKMLCGQEILGIHESYLLVTDAPTIDAVPVVHAHWIRTNSGKWRCSHCRGRHDYPMRYCGECGARMNERMMPDGEKEK